MNGGHEKQFIGNGIVKCAYADKIWCEMLGEDEVEKW